MKNYFGAGPSMLPQYVLEKLSQSIIEYKNTGLSILELPHRSFEFQEILNKSKQIIYQLTALNPDTYEILFLQGGARMEFLRIPQNFLTISSKAGYVDSGHWAFQAQSYANDFGQTLAVASTKIQNYTRVPSNYKIPDDLNYLHLTSNNTIYGTQLHTIPITDVPLICDMSSDIFSRQIDFSRFDMIYACAQKNIGIAGVSLVLIKKSLINRYKHSVPEMLSYKKHIEANNKLNTPAVFAIYSCYEMLNWILNKGLKTIEKQNQEKAAELYAEIDRNRLFEGISNKKDRSLMNVTFILKDKKLTSVFNEMCLAANIMGINGHRRVGGYRVSMYNAMQLKNVRHLIDVMKKLEAQ